MAISGFPIKAQVSGDFIGDVPWFDTARSPFNPVFNVSNKCEFNVNTVKNFKVGQTVDIVGGTYDGETGTITKITNNQSGKKILTDITFINDSDGNTQEIFVDGSLEWDEDTPDNFLREIHIQFDIGGATAFDVEVTLDDSTYMLINNGDEIVGLQTFTMFVQKDSLLNFQLIGGTPSTTISCVVTAA